MAARLHIDQHTCDAPVGASLFECAEKAGVRVPTSCRKQGRCKECVVEVGGGMDLLTPPTPSESHLRENFRLSCCARIAKADGEVSCHTMRRGAMQIERRSFRPGGIGKACPIDPAVTRKGDRILLDGVEVDRRDGPIHGLGIDIGTTTVVLRLLDLESGEVVADAAFENPQRFGGSDVMARIQYDSEDKTQVLRRTLSGYLARAIQDLPVDPLSIYEAVVAGNSTMRDLFFGLSVHSIGQSPYQSVAEREVADGLRPTTSLTSSARRLGLPLNSAARVYGLPIISGHVGADAVACMLAVDLAHEERIVALMDIGTNTELIVGNRHRVYAASCPAGPAFEGGQIAFGMPALPGAIEGVAIADDGRVNTRVIGGGAPEGICGSGLVDLTSELLRTGRMSALGRFEDGVKEFVVAEGGERPITLSEADLNALAQAKGANMEGLRIVAGDYGISWDALDAFYLAGGFGSHLDIGASKRIGLIPNIDDKRIIQVGNSSVDGACIALLSRTKRTELEELIKRVEHRRLETHSGFLNAFTDGCQFGPVEAALEPGGT